MGVSGPTQGAEKKAAPTSTWESHPWLARLLRASIFAIPVIAAALFVWIAGRVAPPDRFDMNRWVWTAIVFVLSNLMVVKLTKVMRRLTPLGRS